MGETVGDASVVVVDLVDGALASSSLDVASKSSLDRKELTSNEKVSFKTRPAQRKEENF